MKESAYFIFFRTKSFGKCVQHITTTAVDFFLSPPCTTQVETEQESCGFARNPMGVWHCVLMAAPRKVRKWYSNEKNYQ